MIMNKKNYFIGIDGGSSKSVFVLYDGSGEALERCELTGSSYRELGADGVCALLEQGVAQVSGGIDRADIKGVCFGMPCYGENAPDDDKATRQIEKALGLPIRFENDVACAWAGPLALESGIVMLAGTGTMAWGCDIHGVMHRCGGWLSFFSDEGSGYWLGRGTLELFSKQSDGRVKRGPLYDIVREHFALNEDVEINGIVEAGYTSSRKKVASLQPLLLRAANAGDTGALELYHEAAGELALMVKGLRGRMELAPGSPVSYAGGLFNAGEIILGPFKKAMAGTDMVFTEPLLTPVDGAFLFAAERFDPENLGRIRESLLNNRVSQL